MLAERSELRRDEFGAALRSIVGSTGLQKTLGLCVVVQQPVRLAAVLSLPSGRFAGQLVRPGGAQLTGRLVAVVLGGRQ